MGGEETTSMLQQSLLAALLSLRPFHTDVETESERLARLTTISAAIAAAAVEATCEGAKPEATCTAVYPGNTRELAFLLVSQAYHETRLAKHVHEGRCRTHIGECDSGRAIGLWQLQAGPHLPKDEWKTLAGTDFDATRRSAFEAARALGRGLNYCRSTRGAIALYATGRTCNWQHADARYASYRNLLARY